MSLKFLFGTVLCLVLVVINTVVSLQDYQGRMDRYDTATMELKGTFIRKPEALSIFVRGF